MMRARAHRRVVLHIKESGLVHLSKRNMHNVHGNNITTERLLCIRLLTGYLVALTTPTQEHIPDNLIYQTVTVVDRFGICSVRSSRIPV